MHTFSFSSVWSTGPASRTYKQLFGISWNFSSSSRELAWNICVLNNDKMNTSKFIKRIIFRSGDEKLVECLSWSHRQTELFLAEQATFLELDESSALSPRELHQILNRIILINPDYPETVRNFWNILYNYQNFR